MIKKKEVRRNLREWRGKEKDGRIYKEKKREYKELL